MATLTIDDKTARLIYPKVPDELKQIMEGAFPTNFFTGKITDRVFSFEDACQEKGRDPKDPFFSECRPHENAIRKMEFVAEVLNEGIELSYKNADQEKWRIWVVWEAKTSGFRLHAVSCAYSVTRAGLGSRTAFASRPLAEHFAEYFMGLINETLA